VADVYVYRNTETVVTTTKELADRVSVDEDDTGHVVGVEVLDAAQVEIDGRPVVETRLSITELPAPDDVDAGTAPRDEQVGALRIAAGDHLFVKLARPANEPWHLVYCPGDQRMSGWQSNECMEGTVPAGRIPVELAVPPAEDVCRPVQLEVAGEELVVAVHGREPMTELDRAHFAEVVAAAQRAVAAQHPNVGVVQELLAASRLARWCIPDGPVGRIGQHDGTAVKDRLAAAARAARDALTPAKQDGDSSC